MTATSDQSILDSVLGWLRAGYPEGIPEQDYVALFAVLHRRLTQTEVEKIAAQLAGEASAPGGDGSIAKTDIEDAIRKLALEAPSAQDVARVASHLAAGGWPLADLADN